MIIEGVVTSGCSSGVLNIAPMGPIVDESMTWLRLRPFQTSTTFANLRDTRCGVFHVTDDVLLIAQAALHRLPDEIVDSTRCAHVVRGRILEAACRWYEFEVTAIDDSQLRSEIECQVVHVGTIREFFGFHRAKHAVLEATILATRLHLIPRDQILSQLRELKLIVDKTAGLREHAAFSLVETYVAENISSEQPC